MADSDPRPVNTGFDLKFGQALKQWRDALAAQGIPTNIISGVRSPQEHQMAWDNFVAGQQGRPLPHPSFGPVSRATRPDDTSTHDVGLGADVQPVNRADLAKMYAMAPKYGISYLGASDPYHFQLNNWQQEAANQPAGMPWATAVAEAQGGRTRLAEGGENISATKSASAGGGFDIPGTTVNSQPHTPTPIPGGSSHADFIRSYAKSIGLDENLALGIANAEGLRAWSAKNPNAASGVDVSGGQPFSFGDFQLNIHPGAMGAKALAANIDPRDPTQWQAADKFALDQMKTGGVGPWKGDPVAKAYLASGKVPAVPAMPASDASAPTTAAGAPGAPTQPAGGSGLNPGFTTKSASDAFQKGFEGLDKAMGGKGLGQGQGQGGDQNGPPEVRESPMVGQRPSAQNVSPLLAMTPMTYGQTINTLQDPRAWSNAPGSPQGAIPTGAGQQGPMGTSINSLSQMLGADPSMAQFPQIDPRLALMGLGGMSGGYG